MTREPESLGSLVEEIDRSRRPSGAGPSTPRDWRRLIVGIAAPLLCIVALTLIAIQVTRRPPDYGAMSRTITLVDAETGDVFKNFKIKDGDTEPWPNPRTGARTLYSPEYCYWNADATAKTTPTYVILNAKLGIEGPTKCPDCGRVVVHHNPEPPVEVMMQAFQAEAGRDPR